MIIDTIQGDLVALFKSGEGHLIHGCNCFHSMGAGVAKNIADTFPQAVKADLKTICGDFNKAGFYSIWFHKVNGRLLYGINLYTQFYGGADASYDLIGKGFTNLNYQFKDEPIPFLIPKIGCGIGGLTWGNVSEIINNTTPDINLIYVDYK